MNYLMHHYLEENAQKYPDKIALKQEDKAYSYKEFNNICDYLSSFIFLSGCSRGDRVGVFLQHSLEQAFSFFSILKSGCVYVPVNSLLLSEQVDYIARDCNFKVLITDDKRLEILKDKLKYWDFLECVIVEGKLPEWLKSLNIKSFSFEEARLSKKNFTDIKNRNSCIGSDLASLLYTSGSTGKPKGVMVTHNNLKYGALIVTDYLKNRHDDILLGVLPLSFDAGLNQLTCSVLLGMTYVMKHFQFPAQIVKVLREEKITGFAGIPTVWLLLLQKGSPVFNHSFPHLRYITNTGGTLPETAVEHLKNVFKETDIVLMYGLTEAFRSTYLPPDLLDEKKGSMGKAIPGVEIMVLRGDGNLCQPGEVGQLVHRGPTVSMGYWNNPEKTKEVFRPNHFLPPGFEDTEKIVFSGDLVKKDDDGFLFFVSRNDHMIKCNGNRISPSDIEEIIYSYGKVKLCAAVGVPDPVSGQIIKVFVTRQDKEFFDELDLISYCAEKLPSFMVPKEIEFVNVMPKTATGKIDLNFLKTKEKKID